MQCAANPRHLAPRRLLRAWTARASVLVVFAASAMMLAACGDSGPTGSARVTPDTSTLAGTWKGSVNGSGGYSALTTVLNADSTMSGEGTIDFYCKATGTWTVSGGKYTSVARACAGIIITSVAPVTKLNLTGTWTASNGTSGTFTVVKQ